jgi:hypothetical protein
MFGRLSGNLRAGYGGGFQFAKSIFFVKNFRHWIESTFRKRPAPEEPLCGEPRSPTRAMPGDGFVSVIRARRIKPAGATKEWRQEGDVEAHEKEERPRTYRPLRA